MDVKILPISQLIDDEKNPNKSTKRGRKALDDSLEKYGAGRSILVDKHGRVIAGNKTLAAAREQGFKNVAVVESSGDTLVAVLRNDLDLKEDKKARELSIADNRVGEFSVWDEKVLTTLDVDLSKFWNAEEIDAMINRTMPEVAAAGAGEGEDDKKVESETQVKSAGTVDEKLKYSVIVECIDEMHQRELLERFEKEGFKVRALIS